LAALAVYDRYSQLAIKRAVREILAELIDTSAIPTKRPTELRRQNNIELKGASRNERGSRGADIMRGLNDFQHLRDKFFGRLINDSHCRIYVLYFDRPDLMKWMPILEERRYGRLLQNLTMDVTLVPQRPSLLGITVDSQNAARPVYENGKVYTWSKRRAAQRNQRLADRARHRRWVQQITAVLRKPYSRAVKTKVWLQPSHMDACLQAIDVIANFCQRYHRLHLRQAPYVRQVVSTKYKKWFDGYRILEPRVWWIHNRRLRKPKHLRVHRGEARKRHQSKE
jgi:hypothetical protein